MGKCGIKEYTERIFNKEYFKTDSIIIKPLNLANCLLSPFQKFDVVHLQHEFFLFDKLVGVTGLFYILYFWFISFFSGSKLVTTVHSVYDVEDLEKALPHFAKFKIIFPILSVYLRFYYYLIIKVSSKTIVLSKSSALVLTKIAPGKATKIIVLPHGVFPRLLEDVNTNFLKDKFNIEKNAQIWTLFGFAFENKGYHLAIEALKRIEKLQKLDLHLIIVSGEGDGFGYKGREGETYLQYLKRLTKDLNLNERVHFTGFLGYDKLEQKALLAEIFTRTFAFLFPYFNRSNASGALASVLSYNKPILVSDIDYFDEFPFLPSFKEGDVEDLANKMVGFNEESKSVIEKISNYIALNNLEGVYNQHVKLYLGVIKGS